MEHIESGEPGSNVYDKAVTGETANMFSLSLNLKVKVFLDHLFGAL